MGDVAEAIARHASPATAACLAQLDRWHRAAVAPVLLRRRQACVPWLETVRRVRVHLAKACPPCLDEARRSLVADAALHAADVLLLQSVSEDAAAPVEDLRALPAGGGWTLGEVLDGLWHAPLTVFFRGSVFALRVYYRDPHSGQCVLPVTPQGRFFTWGYALRMGAVDENAPLPLLTVAGCA